MRQSIGGCAPASPVESAPARPKEATLPSHSKERDEAETRFKKAQKAAQEAKEARAQYEAEARATREKTARLKALRLAKEATEPAAQADKKPVAARRVPSVESADQ
jgi:hypothetical protein